MTDSTPPANTEPRTWLEVDKLRFRYGRDSHWNLDIERLLVKTGEVVAIIGPNGSGKSTLLRLAAGIRKPDTGDVRIGQRSICRLDRREVALRLGYLPQHVSPYFDFTVAQAIRLGRYPHLHGIGSFTDADSRAVAHAMRWTETEHLAQRSLSHLSGGERQRVLLASVLAQEAPLLLLDEPTSSLDAHHQVSFFSLLRRLAGAGTGIAVVTHDINLAALFADRIYLLAKGRLTAEGTPAEVITDEIMKAAYGPELVVISHPQCDKPVVLPAVHLQPFKHPSADQT